MRIRLETATGEKVLDAVIPPFIEDGAPIVVLSGERAFLRYTSEGNSHGDTTTIYREIFAYALPTS